MESKYGLVLNDTMEVNGKTLYRLLALRHVCDGVNNGDIGGYIESEKNLSHDGSCWIYDGAFAMGNTTVSGDEKIYGEVSVKDESFIYEYARVYL